MAASSLFCSRREKAVAGQRESLRESVLVGQSKLVFTEVHGEVIMTLVSDSTSSPNGTFVCRCFITPPNGEPVGWQNDSSISGGEHHVKRR
jgi:hypothetical protein